MKSLYEQEKIIFNRFANKDFGCFGKGITVKVASELLGEDAVQYATNAEGEQRRKYSPYRMGNVLLRDGFLEAFRFFWMQEILRGEHDAYTTPDYLERFGIGGGAA